MHISMLLMEQIVELFIMIFMGFAIVKAGIVKDEESKVLSKIVLYLVIPCVIVNAFQVDYTAQTVKGLMIVFLAVITPSASTVTQMCQVYGNDSQYASAINVVTTLSAIITMPVMVLLFENIIM
mgnify:CR=1 FL=1